MSHTVETLRADYPDLVAQIETAARVGFVAADSMSGGGPMCATCSCQSCTSAGGQCNTCTMNPKAEATSARTALLDLHGAVFGEDAGKRFKAIVDSGVTADQAKALGVTASGGEAGSHEQILAALHAAAPNGLRPGQVQTATATAGIDTSAIYASRQGQK